MSRISFDDTPSPVKSTVSLLSPVAAAPNLPAVSQRPAPQPVSTALRVVTDEDLDRLATGRTTQSSSIVNEILASQRASDAEELGVKLNAIISSAKGLDPAQLGKQGLLQKLTHLGSSVKEKFQAQYDVVEKRLDTLVASVAPHFTRQASRIKDYERMLESNRQLCLGFESDKADAEQLAAALRQQIASFGTSTDVFAAEDKARVQRQLERVEKMIFDFEASITHCHQREPLLARMQEQARTLVAAYYTFERQLLPILKETYAEYILNLEQKKAAEVANLMYDATDQALRRQAELANRNGEEIARLGQRPAITVETLEYRQKLFTEGAEKIRLINEEGERMRRDALPRLQAIDQQLIANASRK
ncbi:hypothetical protein F6X40_35310 [Paraburkholderia sp. UCT31]|uniref:toxic anion resistance protein n=1 Tax=Paraburkholderia sp. UCT31 TaxID=2615209 RepID=UPI001655791B|nr:toxic anion resistance protein [Paraburkholderia sp. UCT31]MBC8741819.1 hypothetical protein [Paraburkholderia sp. UCT31]